MNTNIHLTELGHAKATLCKRISNFCKHHKQIRIHEKVFSLKKIISLKHNGVRSCFEVFIETNTPMQSDFDLLGVETMIISILKLCACMRCLVLSLSLICMQHPLSERPYDQSDLRPA